ncbi:hypothetical protein D3C76_1052560 [compost metagenome]
MSSSVPLMVAMLVWLSPPFPCRSLDMVQLAFWPGFSTKPVKATAGTSGTPFFLSTMHRLVKLPNLSSSRVLKVTLSTPPASTEKVKV